MPSIVKLAAGAVAILVVVVVGFRFLPASAGIGGPTVTPVPTPSPTPSPTSSPSPSPSPSPALFPNGSLPAGSYTIQPFVGPGGLCVGQPGCTEAGAEDDSIRITLTVPDGWAGLEYSIVPSVESYSPPRGGGLLFGRGGWLYPPPSCAGPGISNDGPTIPTGTTVDAFVTALVDHPDLDVTSPVDVTLGGYSGQYLELRAPANVTTAELGPDPSGCGFFVWEPGIYAQGPNALWRIWVLDVDGVRVVVRADSFPGTTPQVQAQLQAIVDSIQIES